MPERLAARRCVHIHWSTLLCRQSLPMTAIISGNNQCPVSTERTDQSEMLCRENQLTYQQFICWCAQFDTAPDEPATPVTASRFLPVTLMQPVQPAELEKTLPNGVQINGVNEQTSALAVHSLNRAAMTQRRTLRPGEHLSEDLCIMIRWTSGKVILDSP